MSNILEREESVEQVFNFLEVTLKAITKSGHTEGDILLVGSSKTNHTCSWREFKILADVDNYDETESCVEVASDLLIVFDDTTVLWRDEREGQEYWNYAPVPFFKGKQHRIKNIFPHLPGQIYLSDMIEG